MKLALILPLALAAFVGVARAEEADDIREASKAEAETFNARMYAGTPGNKAYACFVRRYDAEHLARHPKQKVASMKLLVSAEIDEEDKQLHNSFRLGFRYRHRSRRFQLQRLLSPRGVRQGRRRDPPRLRRRLRRRRHRRRALEGRQVGHRAAREVRVWLHNKPDDEAERSLVAGSDDGIFRLDRTDNSECASLVTDRKELAALRHK